MNLPSQLTIIAANSAPCRAVRMNTPLGIRPSALPTVSLRCSETEEGVVI